MYVKHFAKNNKPDFIGVSRQIGHFPSQTEHFLNLVVHFSRQSEHFLKLA